MKRLILVAVALLWGLPLDNAFARQSTNPTDYTSIIESTRRGEDILLEATFGEIDGQSLIKVQFDEGKMSVPLDDGSHLVEIRVEAFQTRNGVRTPIVPIENYVSRSAAGKPPEQNSKPVAGKPPEQSPNPTAAYVFHDKPYGTYLYQHVPDTILNLSGLRANDADQIEIRVTNIQTQESLVCILQPRQFGFRVGMTDSLLFLKRLSVSQQDGVTAVNFAPAPGVTYGATYLSRRPGFVRFLQPGMGFNVSFMSWKDPAFDIATGKFVSGTKSSDLNIGLGAQFSLFNNVLLFNYGANLQAEQNRWYFGIGVSFVNLSTKIAQRIP